MTMLVSTVGLSLTNFTAHDLPANKWLKLIHPKMRVRVRTANREFVSPSVKLDGIKFSSAHWPWSDDARPLLSDGEKLEIEVERRFLLRYECIRRTKPTTMNQIRDGNYRALPLYDGQMPAGMLQDGNRLEIGGIAFSSDAIDEDTTSTDTASISTFVGTASPHKEHGQR